MQKRGNITKRPTQSSKSLSTSTTIIHRIENPHHPQYTYTNGNDQMSSSTVHVSFPPYSRESPGPSGVAQRTGRHQYPIHSTYHSCVLMDPRARGCRPIDLAMRLTLV